jgi:protease II
LAEVSLLPPAAKIVPKEITVHCDTRVDNYFWLRDRSDPDVVAYLEAENRYTEEVMAPTKPLQETLYKEILGRIQETDLSVPVRRDDYFYYTRTEEGRAYAIYGRKHGSLDAAEEILLDANVLAEGQKYFRLGNFAVSPDHRLLAYSTDVEGDESYTIFVKDLVTGELLPDRIANTYYTLEWANDNRTFFYTTLDETRRPYRVFRHERTSWFTRKRTVDLPSGFRRRGAEDSFSSNWAARSHRRFGIWKRTSHAVNSELCCLGGRGSSTMRRTTANTSTSARMTKRKAFG